ncbi:protein terminal ear1 homolog [Amaranthus tricolor]|uniref:protein terminal ear1 homolog n=1 Tax=Amaranthus tricolor TaxID=29722 RepID=UPI00258554F3|nr:protein terminal ear1 homolog [Amaranthus tricolor]
MSQNDVVRFHGNLDPSAQEFRPTYHPHHHLPFLPHPPLQPFYPDSIYLPVQINPNPLPSPVFVPPSIPPPASSPTRALLLTAVPADVSESLIRRELEIFGDVRAVQMERVSEGIVTVHFYDLRVAHAALDSVREQHMQHQNRLRIYYSSILAPNNTGPIPGLEVLAGPPPPPPPSPGLIAGRPVWAQFCIPATNAFPDGQNQGTIVIFNLNPTLSALALKDIFQTFGAVKELRETPLKRHQRFVEFYDVRDASRALLEMNGKEINGRSVMIEYSRPGGHSNKKFNHHFNPINKNFSAHNHSTNDQILNPPLLPPQQPPPFNLRHKRTSPRQNARCRRSSPSSEESLEAAMNGLALRGGNGNGNRNRIRNEERENVGVRNSGGNNNGNCSSHKSLTKTKPWKGKQKNFDPRFLIKEEAVIEESGSCKDNRTTVMIKNIPNKYSQKLLLNMLDNHCIHCNEQITAAEEDDDLPLSSYDFVYLPIDFNNKCNVGYGFVNMTSPEATLRLYKAFHHQHWEVFNSRKICEVTYARVQGLEALKEHFKNSKFACENDEYLPVVFSPPRDGRNLPAPLPIVFSNTTTSSTVHLECTDIDGSDFASSTTSTITTHHFDHDNSNTISGGDQEATNDNSNDDDSTTTRSSNGGGDVLNEDDGGSSNSSMGCSIAD